MPTTGKRGEDALIELFLRVYEGRSWAGHLSRHEYPERVKDGGVEIIATQVATGRTLAIEHTVIEPFVGEKTDFHETFQELQRQLRADDSLKEPGVALYVDAPVSVLPKGVPWQPIIDDVRAFLLAQKSTFGTTKEIRDCLSPHHPKKTIQFQVRRQPLDRTAAGFVIVQRYGELRVVESVRKALDKKLPKLAATDVNIRILMLERDQAWIDSDEILQHIEVLKPEFPGFAAVNEIWIADTATFGPPREWVEFARRGDGNKPSRLPFIRASCIQSNETVCRCRCRSRAAPVRSTRRTPKHRRRLQEMANAGRSVSPASRVRRCPVPSGRLAGVYRGP